MSFPITPAIGEIKNDIFDFNEIKDTHVIDSPTSEEYKRNSSDKEIKIGQEEYFKAFYEARTHYLSQEF